MRDSTGNISFVSFWQYFPHSSDCFPHSFSSQEFGKTSLWNKYHSVPCDFGKFVGKTHYSCKFLGHSRPNGLSWPKNLHSRWVFSSLIFPRSREWKMIIFSVQVCHIPCHEWINDAGYICMHNRLNKVAPSLLVQKLDFSHMGGGAHASVLNIGGIHWVCLRTIEGVKTLI